MHKQSASKNRLVMMVACPFDAIMGVTPDMGIK